mmetsp:Transcript_7420/g.15788  ORF Transcript_7420/g.15788 Transcript_7420/m.15788 type:complete len:86 (+) Transcript_7420:401-658(+)
MNIRFDSRGGIPVNPSDRFGSCDNRFQAKKYFPHIFLSKLLSLLPECISAELATFQATNEKGLGTPRMSVAKQSLREYSFPNIPG